MPRWVSMIALVLCASCARPMPCNYYGCEGCCSADGECLPGKVDEACGADGNQCMVCSANEKCIQKACEAVMYDLHLSLTVEGQPCPQADLRGADSFEASVVVRNPFGQDANLTWPVDCSPGVIDLSVPIDSYATYIVVYGRRSGVDVLKGSTYWISNGNAAVDLKAYP